MYSTIEQIINRGSVRTYDQDAVMDIAAVASKINEINGKTGPFGNKIKVSLVSSDLDSSEMKLGTYGMIKGASNYLAVSIIPTNGYALVDLGYLFEEVILFATSQGLGTVWMAGTFSKKHFASALNLQQDEQLPIVSPIGIASDKKSFVNKYIAKSKTHVRKEFKELFSTIDGRELNFEQHNPLMQALEMVRLAPSAMNKQPWRVVKDGNDFHFYATNDKESTKIDIGIALYHFISSLIELGVDGAYYFEPNQFKENYIATWKPIN